MTHKTSTFKRWSSTPAVTALLLLSSHLVAATIPVENNCSLVDAITAANTDSAINGCPAGSGADIITLQADSIITLTEPAIFPQAPQGLPQIKSPITIQGNGAIIERDDTSDSLVLRIFQILSSGTLRLENLTVRNGLSGTNSEGGGIDNRGDLTLLNVTVSGNRALTDSTGGSGGGIANLTAASLTIINSTIRDNFATGGAGGIINRGSLMIENSIISGNGTGGGGGGIVNFFDQTANIIDTVISDNTADLGDAGLQNLGTMTISGSTISGNIAGQFSGGISSQGSITIINSTISGNSATDLAGGGIRGSGTVNVINSTIVNNTAPFGAGIWIVGDTPANLTNTIIANNTGGDCSSDPVYVGNGTNWFGDDSCDGVAAGDPLLGLLADNGGPTRTHALLSGSGAINAGDNTVCSAAQVNSKDQRGELRPEPGGSQCDVGAFESQDLVTPPPEGIFKDSFE